MPGPLFVRVFIWRNLGELRAYRWLDMKGSKGPSARSTGCCMQHTWTNRNHNVADVHFSMTYLNDWIVAHEFFHATIHWLARLKRPLATVYSVRKSKSRREWDSEEMGAEIIEELIRQFQPRMERILAKKGQPGGR